MDTDGLFPLAWPVDYAQCAPCAPFEDDETGAETKAKFEDMARWFLWRWTKRTYGTATSTLRPSVDCWRAPTYSQMPESVSWPLRCGDCRSANCGCSSMTSLWLSAPIVSVERVVIDGVELPAESYRLDGRHRVVRTDGASWPSRQDENATIDEPGSWGLEVVAGAPVPTGGRIAAASLACELALAACNDKNCRLPQRIQSITRQGVAMTMLDDFDGLQKGRTGVWLIDSWVASVTEAPIPATVVNPDKWLSGKRGPMTRMGR